MKYKTVLYKSHDYNKDNAVLRYVRFCKFGDEFRLVEVDINKRTILEAVIDRDELPAGTAERAVEAGKYFPPYVVVP